MADNDNWWIRRLEADDDQLDTLLKLIERYCVVFQTLSNRPELRVSR